MNRFAVASLVGAALLAGTGASAQALLTSAAGYSGPVLNIGSYANNYFTFTAGPVSLPGGITYTSTTGNSVIGDGGYGLGSNGYSTTNIIGINSPYDTITLSFATPVSEFGALMNYAPGYGDDVISAYDASNNLIATYDLDTLAPISTPGGVNQFDFRGIDGGGTLISSFTISGGYGIAAAGGIPEPAAWTLMLLGAAGLGATLRRRARLAAAA